MDLNLYTVTDSTGVRVLLLPVLLLAVLVPLLILPVLDSYPNGIASLTTGTFILLFFLQLIPLWN